MTGLLFCMNNQQNMHFHDTRRLIICQKYTLSLGASCCTLKEVICISKRNKLNYLYPSHKASYSFCSWTEDNLKQIKKVFSLPPIIMACSELNIATQCDLLNMMVTNVKLCPVGAGFLGVTCQLYIVLF